MRSETEKIELNMVRTMANDLNLKYSPYSLPKLSSGNNVFEVEKNMVFFYPPNDGMPIIPIEFYKDNNFVLYNRRAYSEISNLDTILLQMVRIYDKALDKNIVIDPYYFMLELTDKVVKNYHGKAKLIVTEKAIRNQKLSQFNFDKANRYYINHFLDHFMGWNFGVSINRNEELKKELHQLNDKVIDMNLREFAGTGFEVYGTENEVTNGLQHYYLPTEKPNIKKLTTE